MKRRRGVCGEFIRRAAQSCVQRRGGTRGIVAGLVRLQERAARNVTAGSIEKKLLVSASPRTPLRLGFPIEVVERWFPSLYPAAG